MNNGRRPAKPRSAAKAVKAVKKAKAVKHKAAKRKPLQLEMVAAPASPPKPKAEIHFVPGPIPAPEVRQEGRYVYGIIPSNQPITFGKMGIGGAGEMVYAVTHGDISAVVSRTGVFIFDPTRENALAHEHVIEIVMRTHTIIPMSFGTVFRTDDDIREGVRRIGKIVAEQVALYETLTGRRGAERAVDAAPPGATGETPANNVLELPRRGATEGRRSREA